jgi:hypothetical protein
VTRHHFPVLLLAALGIAAACSATTHEAPGGALPSTKTGDLRSPADFAGIADDAERSRALFLEAHKVLSHPRCVNCHPSGDIPHNGDALALHDMPVIRGPENKGVVGMECTGCHQDRNQEMIRVPGAPKWALAPREMAWVGKTAGQICEQLKDRARNGGKSLEEIAHHAEKDELVAWGWSPGADRTPAPGTQAKFGALVRAWIEAGAACPTEKAPLGEVTR